MRLCVWNVIHVERILGTSVASTATIAAANTSWLRYTSAVTLCVFEIHQQWCSENNTSQQYIIVK